MTVYGGDPIYADDINAVSELLDSAGVVVTTAAAPLTSSSGTDVAVASLAYEFVSGYAYEISYGMRMQINGGTSPFVVYSKLRRASAAGTVIIDPGGTAVITTNFIWIEGRTIVRRTAATTTQTIVSVAAFGTTGAPTSIDLEASATSPAFLNIRPIGLAANYSTAPEVPTS